MKWYLLFYRYKDNEGGACDFYGAYTDLEEAKRQGIAYWEDTGARLSSWMHLAEFDGTDMSVLFALHIPDTEYADGEEDDELEWREVTVEGAAL